MALTRTHCVYRVRFRVCSNPNKHNNGPTTRFSSAKMIDTIYYVIIWCEGIASKTRKRREKKRKKRKPSSGHRHVWIGYTSTNTHTHTLTYHSRMPQRLEPIFRRLIAKQQQNVISVTIRNFANSRQIYQNAMVIAIILHSFIHVCNVSRSTHRLYTRVEATD